MCGLRKIASLFFHSFFSISGELRLGILLATQVQEGGSHREWNALAA